MHGKGLSMGYRCARVTHRVPVEASYVRNTSWALGGNLILLSKAFRAEAAVGNWSLVVDIRKYSWGGERQSTVRHLAKEETPHTNPRLDWKPQSVVL